MPTALDYFHKANPHLKLKQERIKTILNKVNKHRVLIDKRLESGFTFKLYDRSFEWLEVNAKLCSELRGIEELFEEYCRKTLRLY